MRRENTAFFDLSQPDLIQQVRNSGFGRMGVSVLPPFFQQDLLDILGSGLPLIIQRRVSIPIRRIHIRVPVQQFLNRP